MPEADAVPKLVEDAKLDRLMLRTEQCERLMLHSLNKGDHIRAARYRRLCAEATRHCLDLLTE